MRTKLKDGTVIKLTSGIDSKGTSKEITIDRIIGTGASAIVYEAHYYDGVGQVFKCRLKECYPYNAKAERIGNEIVFDNTEKGKAFEEFKNAYNIQKMFQNDENTGNQTVHLFDLCSGNGTLYSVMDVNFGETFTSNNTLESTEQLLKTLEVILVLTKIIAGYHKKGYLHLDIKPSNFLVSYEPSIDIKLFDVDSVIKTEEVRNTKVISYSQDWAAPEQIIGNRNKICPATDLYAIGAILFEKIMGRKVCVEDRGVFAKWDFNLEILEKANPKLKRLIENIFRKTLAANVKRRYQSADELVETLKQAIDIIQKGQPYILSHFALSDNYFVGRQEELTKIHEAFKKDCRFIFLSGMGGIGKSEIAKNYAKRFEKEYYAILFFQYHNSLKTDVIDKIKIQNCDDIEGERQTALQAALNKNVLLIIDNFDVEEDEYLEELNEYDCKFLFTTRMHSDDYFSNNVNNLTINVNNLSREEQILLFTKEYGKQLSDEETEIVESILTETEGYTLLIPLIAKQLKNGRHSFKEFFGSLHSSGVKGASSNIIRHSKDGRVKGNLYEILRQVLTMSFDDDSYAYIMRCMSLLDGIYIKRKKLEDLIGTQYAEEIDELIFRNWINVDGIGADSVLYIHKVISQICKEEMKPSTENCKEFLRSVLDYTNKKAENNSEKNVKNKFFELIMNHLSGSDDLMTEFYLAYIDNIKFRKDYFDAIIDSCGNRDDESTLKILIRAYYLNINDSFNDDRLWDGMECETSDADFYPDAFINNLASETMFSIRKSKEFIELLEKYDRFGACDKYYALGNLLYSKAQDLFLGAAMELNSKINDDIFKEIIELFDRTADLLKTIDFANDKKIQMYRTMSDFYEDDFTCLSKPDFCKQPKKVKMYADLINSLENTRSDNSAKIISANDISNAETALQLFSIGDYTSAIEYFAKALEEDEDIDIPIIPINCTADIKNVYTGLAESYFRTGKKSEAVKALDDAKNYMLKYNWKYIEYEITTHKYIADEFFRIQMPLKALEQYKWIWNRYYETNADNEELNQIFINIATNIYILSNDKNEKHHFYGLADNIYTNLDENCEYFSNLFIFIKEKIKKLEKNKEYKQIAYMLINISSHFILIGNDEFTLISEALDIIDGKVDDMLLYEASKELFLASDGYPDRYAEFAILFYEKSIAKNLYLNMEMSAFVQDFINVFDKYIDSTDLQKSSITNLSRKILSIFLPANEYEKYLEACVYKIWADNCCDIEAEREPMEKCNYYLISEHKCRGVEFEQKQQLWNDAIYKYSSLSDEYSMELCFHMLFNEWKDCINSDYNSSFDNLLRSIAGYGGYIECLLKQEKFKKAREVLKKTCASCIELIKNDPEKDGNIFKYFENLATGMEFIQDNINTIFMHGVSMLSRIEKEKILDNCSLPDIDECTVATCEDILRKVLEKEVNLEDKDYINERCNQVLDIAVVPDDDKYKTLIQLCNQIINKNTYDEYSFK